MDTPFENSRYEYTTREYATTHAIGLARVDDQMEAQGWTIAWRDVTTEGTFAVYRRVRTHSSIRMTDAERQIAQHSEVDAAKAVRHRLCCPLKDAVEIVRRG